MQQSKDEGSSEVRGLCGCPFIYDSDYKEKLPSVEFIVIKMLLTIFAGISILIVGV